MSDDTTGSRKFRCRGGYHEPVVDRVQPQCERAGGRVDFDSLVAFARVLIVRACNAECLDVDRNCLQRAVRQAFVGRWRVATMCSGSEAPMVALDAAYVAAGSMFSSDGGIPTCVQHMFSAEADRSKQNFVRAVMGNDLQHLFADVRCLGESTALDVVKADTSGVQAEVPGADELFAGFPCTDVSSLNPYSKTEANRQTVACDSLRTGTCFRGIGRWAARHRPKLMLLENVMGLAAPGPQGSNLNVCIEVLESIGYCVRVYKLSPTLFGWPQRRPRLWMVCVDARAIGHQVATLHRVLDSLLHAFCGHAMTSLSDIVLPDHNSLVHEALTPPPKRRARGLLDKEPKWLNNHIELSLSKGQDWCGLRLPAGDIGQLYPGVLTLTDRQVDLLAVCGIPVPDVGSSDPLVRDISQDRLRDRGMRGVSDCVTPNGILWHSHLCRKLVGAEALRLQGIFYREPVNSLVQDTFSGAFLHDLAGNAFNTHCVIACHLAAKIALVVAQGATGGGSADLSWCSLLLWGHDEDSDSDAA